VEWSSESLEKFNDILGSNSPTPGGGAAAAAAASISTALLAMVTALTENGGEIAEAGRELKEYLKQSYRLIDEDCRGFGKVMEAYSLPAGGQDEKEQRHEKIEEALKAASRPPQELMELALKILKTANAVVKKGNRNAWTETGIAAELAFTSLKASYYNVMINTCSISDESFNRSIVLESREKLEQGKELKASLENYLEEEIINCPYL